MKSTNNMKTIEEIRKCGYLMADTPASLYENVRGLVNAGESVHKATLERAEVGTIGCYTLLFYNGDECVWGGGSPYHVRYRTMIHLDDISKVIVTPLPKDTVNSPSHYTKGSIECIEAIKEATNELTGIEAVCTGNAIKYLWRWKHKNGVEDLKKAQWYIGRLIKEVGGE